MPSGPPAQESFSRKEFIRRAVGLAAVWAIAAVEALTAVFCPGTKKPIQRADSGSRGALPDQRFVELRDADSRKGPS